MAEDSGLIGFGTGVGYADTENGSYTFIAELTDVTPPTIEVNDVDVTNHGLVDLFRDFTPGLGNAGEVEFKLLFDKTAEALLYSLIRTSKFWKVQLPLDVGESTASNWKCLGYIKSLGTMTPLDDKMECSCKIKLRRKPAFNPGS